MSFWPFGQNLNSPTNNINKILDEYFSVLHTIEQKQQQQSGTSNNVIGSLGSGGISITKTNSNSRTSLLKAENDNLSNDNDNNIIFNDFENIKNPLSSKFIDEILEESEIINELNRKNSTLLDFICFGYFYDSDTENGNKVSNIEYLVSLLLHCCQVIDKHMIEEKIQNDEKNNDLNNVMKNNDVRNDNDNMKHDEDDKILRDDDTIINDNLHNSSSAKRLALKPSNLMSPANSAHRLSTQSSRKTTDKDEYKSIDICLKKCEIIAEIFSLNIWLITESLVKTSVFLAEFWSFLSYKSFKYEQSPISSVFLKINTNLLINRQDQFLNFVRTFLLRSGSLTFPKVEESLFENDKNISVEEIQSLSQTQGLVEDMLQYIDSPLINDFFLKIIATDKRDTPTGVLELVFEQNLVTRLLDFFQNDLYEAEIQTCSCDFFKAIIAISANAPIDDLTIGPNCLTRQLCTDPIILNKLLNIIVKEGSHALGNVVSIVIELIRKNNSDYDQVNLLQTTLKLNPPNSRDPIYLGYMVRKFTDNLHLIFRLLQTPYNNKPNDASIFETDPNFDSSARKNTMNEFFTPLGFEKFRIVELIAELLHCSNMGLMNSRRAEKISRKRDSIRLDLPLRLEEALEDLKLFSSNQEEPFNEKEGTTTTASPISFIPPPADILKTDDGKYMIDSDPGSDNSSPETEMLSANVVYGKVPQSTPTSSSTTNGISPSDLSSFDFAMQNENYNTNNINNLNLSTNGSHSGKEINSFEENIDSTFYDMEEQQILQIPEMDEFFDIPYVSLAQNIKIRENATIGDYFKSRVVNLQILPYLVSMFLKYPWNNFWHNVIFDILQQIFNGRMDYAYNSFLVYSLFNNKQIHQFWDKTDSLNFNGGKPMDFNLCKNLVIKGYELSNAYYFKNNFSLGYMGHLVLIAEEIVKFSKIYKVDLISPDIQIAVDNVKWIYYVEDILMDTRLMFSKILGGDIISTNGPEEEYLLKQQQEKRQRELLEMGLLDDLETDELLLYSTQEELQKKLKTRLLERPTKEIEQELIRLEISKQNSTENSEITNAQLLEGT
ncbi:hypothetical protein QEN19_001104 [Hanseniaspora menglaensis]